MANIKIFDNKKIRAEWNAEEEEWYFSIVDVVEVLTDSSDPKQYLKKMRTRDEELSANWGTICTPIEMDGKDGKIRKVLAANTKGLLRLIQSIPSKKAEPFKMWLAQVGAERIDEIVDPQLAMDRAVETYRQKGYTEEWITQRLLSIKIRKELTDEWKERGIVEESDYAILTNEMTKAWSGKTVREYKEYKGLKKENLRDNMTDIELVLNMLAEVTTKNISQNEQPSTFDGSVNVAKRGGKVAGDARKGIEKELGQSVVSPLNANDAKMLDTKKDQ